MPIYELTAYDPDNINWRTSMVKDRAVIRAEDEMDARLFAANTFRIAAIPYFLRQGRARAAGEPVSVPPWTDPTLVACREIEDSDWEADGPSAVLAPEGFADRPVEPPDDEARPSKGRGERITNSL